MSPSGPPTPSRCRDPEDFAALYHAEPGRALALVAAMTEPQRVCQALAYAAWLDYHGLETRHRSLSRAARRD